MKYQPVDIKTVLAKLSDALIAGRSDILMSSRVSGGCGITVNNERFLDFACNDKRLKSVTR